MEQDLTVGSVPSRLLRFSLPMLGANLLQSFYNLVDMAVVGRFVGSDGLAAVSSAVLLCYIISALCSGVTMGGGVLCAQYRGAGDRRGLEEAVSTLFLVSAAASALVTGVALLAYRNVFTWMNLPAEALPHALAYMPVIAWGTVFVFGCNAACAVLRGVGDAGSPLAFIAVSSAVNVGLDFLLVGGLDLGAAGAAWATVAAQAISCLLGGGRRRDLHGGPVYGGRGAGAGRQGVQNRRGGGHGHVRRNGGAGAGLRRAAGGPL